MQTPTQTKPRVDLPDWTVQHLVDEDAAVLVGPRGRMVVGIGENIRGIGQIDAIKRSGRQLIVETSKGVITSRTPAEPTPEPPDYLW